MNLRRITSAEDKDFKKLAELYIEAFPPEERREISQLERLLKSRDEMFYNAWSVTESWPLVLYTGISEIFGILNIWRCMPICVTIR